MYVCCIHACATGKLESQRTAAGSKTPEKGAAAAGRTKLLLYHYCRIQDPRDTRGTGGRRTRGGIRRDTKGTGGHRDTARTGGYCTVGGSGETPRGPEGTRTNGGIRACPKATGTQRPWSWRLHRLGATYNVQYSGGYENKCRNETAGTGGGDLESVPLLAAGYFRWPDPLPILFLKHEGLLSVYCVLHVCCLISDV
jgi:hypothetical protein